MKIENIKKVELIIQEINELQKFIDELPDNARQDDKIFFGNEQNPAELHVVFKGKTIKKIIEDIKYNVFQTANKHMKELKNSLHDL